jgi:hypothetical protein
MVPDSVRTARILPAWPATAGGRKPGRSVTGISAIVSPIASAAGTQPEPITRATSKESTPTALFSAVAASVAST